MTSTPTPLNMRERARSIANGLAVNFHASNWEDRIEQALIQVEKEGFERGVGEAAEIACCKKYPEIPCPKILSLLTPKPGGRKMIRLPTIILDFEKILLQEGYERPVSIEFTSNDCQLLKLEFADLIHHCVPPLAEECIKFLGINILGPKDFKWK